MKEFLSYEQNLDRHSRPEDELETEAEVTIAKRERAFAAEGGFRDLIKLKAALEDLTYPHSGSMLAGGIDMNSYVHQLLEDPEGKGKEKLPELKKKWIRSIDMHIATIGMYKEAVGSDAFSYITYKLGEMKKQLLDDQFLEFGEGQQTLKTYVQGMNRVVELSVGREVERDDIRKQLKLPENPSNRKE